MIEKELLEKYGEYLDQLDISETNTSLKLSMIKVKPEYRYQKSNLGTNLKIGTKVMTDLARYADANMKIMTLTPDNIDGVSVNVLTQFYKKFGFKMNKGYNKNFEYRDTMIRYPKLPGMKESLKPMIKSLLREALDKTITCKKCGWHWKESESDKKDLYICHECGNDNTPKKQTLNEAILNKTDKDLKIIADFVNFAKDFLSIEDDIKVALAFERTPDLTTSAYYNYVDKKLKVYVKDRAIMDVCRSIAHELVHHKQNLEDRLLNGEKDGADGSDIENEANAVAGVIIRKWGKKNPKLYI
jgi:hypothetical protein